jgi:hypothetical protein
MASVKSTSTEFKQIIIAIEESIKKEISVFCNNLDALVDFWGMSVFILQALWKKGKLEIMMHNDFNSIDLRFLEGTNFRFSISIGIYDGVCEMITRYPPDLEELDLQSVLKVIQEIAKDHADNPPSLTEDYADNPPSSTEEITGSQADDGSST